MKTAKIGVINITNLGQRFKEKQHLLNMVKVKSEENKLNETFKKVAKSVYPKRIFVSVYDVSDVPSLQDRILLYRDFLSRTSGDWAPWSKSLKK